MDEVELYTELPPQTIRLLHPEPAVQPHFPLTASLHTVTLDYAKNVSYEALSYAWAGAFCEDPLPATIRLNRVNVTITGNLGHALRRLRTLDTTRVLWIDSLCINQKNMLEKSYQVRVMSVLYSLAAQTVIWLGEDSAFHDGEIVLHCIEQSNRGSPLKQTDEMAKAVDEVAKVFASRRYFSRRWVVQEYTNSQSLQIVCGASVVDWPKACDFHHWAEQLHRASHRGYEELLDPRNLDGPE